MAQLVPSAHHRTQHGAQSGALNAPQTGTVDDVAAKIVAAAEAVVGMIGLLDADMPLMEAGVDSYHVSEFAAGLERIFKLPISSHIVFECGTARAIAQRLISASGSSPSIAAAAAATSGAATAAAAAALASRSTSGGDRHLVVDSPVGHWPGGYQPTTLVRNPSPPSGRRGGHHP